MTREREQQLDAEDVVLELPEWRSKLRTRPRATHTAHERLTTHRDRPREQR